MRKIVGALAFIIVGVAVGAQTSQPTARKQAPKPVQAAPAPAPAPLTNTDVIRMAKAGLDDEIILAAIQKAERKTFDASADGLIQLKTGGVSSRIIRAVQNGGFGPPAVLSVPPPASVQAVPADSAAGASTPRSSQSETASPEGQDDPQTETTSSNGIIGSLKRLGIGVRQKVSGKKDDNKLGSGATVVAPGTDQSFKVDYVSGKAGFKSKISGRLVIGDAALTMMDGQTGAFKIPLQSVTKVTSTHEKINEANPIKPNREVALVSVISETDRAEVVVFQISPKSEQSLIAQVQFASRRARGER